MFERIVFITLWIPESIITASGRLVRAWKLRMIETRRPL
jgi:hypothetical protein